MKKTSFHNFVREEEEGGRMRLSKEEEVKEGEEGRMRLSEEEELEEEEEEEEEELYWLNALEELEEEELEMEEQELEVELEDQEGNYSKENTLEPEKAVVEEQGNANQRCIKRKEENQIVARLSLNQDKAGLEGVDKAKANQVIFEASKDSAFYKNELRKDQSVTKKIYAMKTQLEAIKKEEEKGILHPFLLEPHSILKRKIDRTVAQLELTRDLSRTVVHVDMDAFYASVETLEDPSLETKPMAVGSIGMISTANYAARKFGVRSAMPGYIALKLCPNLLFIKPNFHKYQKYSNLVKKVLAEYDPHFVSLGMDEAFVDLTEHLKLLPEGITAAEVVNEMRTKIYQQTQLTASAGISANGMLAKICSDMGKPNGQFEIPRTREAILTFLKNLPIRKVSGIGKVSERILRELGYETCGDLYEGRFYLAKLFSPISFDFFLRVSLGVGVGYFDSLGSTTKESNNTTSRADRKSIGVERTFREISSPEQLRCKCLELCNRLASDVENASLEGKVVTVKLKHVDFRSFSRAITLSGYIDQVSDLKDAALKILDSEIASAKTSGISLRLRLMGVRLSNLRKKVSRTESSSSHCSPIALAFSNLSKLSSGIEKHSDPAIGEKTGSCDGEDPAIKSCKSRSRIERFFTAGVKRLDTDERNVKKEGKSARVECSGNDSNMKSEECANFDNEDWEEDAELNKENETKMECPVCSKPWLGSSQSLSLHVEECLSLSAIEEIKRSDSLATTTSFTSASSSKLPSKHHSPTLLERFLVFNKSEK